MAIAARMPMIRITTSSSISVKPSSSLSALRGRATAIFAPSWTLGVCCDFSICPYNRPSADGPYTLQPVFLPARRAAGEAGMDAHNPTVAARARVSRLIASATAARSGRRLNLGRTYRGLSLYVRVVIVNASVLLVPTLLLSLTPAYVPFPGSVTDVLVLVLGLLV